MTAGTYKHATRVRHSIPAEASIRAGAERRGVDDPEPPVTAVCERVTHEQHGRRREGATRR